MTDPAEFLFVTCQIEADRPLKTELARSWPEFRFAYSRPGFLTFKIPPGSSLTRDWNLGSVFARAYGISLGKVNGSDPDELAAGVCRQAAEVNYQAIHVWQRDTSLPGKNGFEPGVTPLAQEAGLAIARRASQGDTRCLDPASINRSAGRGQWVLDCILVQPNEWWVGRHRVRSVSSRWPGGVIPIRLPEDAVSRAYLKTVEALCWSRLPVRQGDTCVELGSAPGGSSQALLEYGLVVYGVDPARMDPTVLRHRSFQHLKVRAANLKRHQYRGVHWLVADMNVAPKYTLDVVDSIVTHRDVNIRGLLLTLKFPDWKLAGQLPDYLARVRSWGFREVKARHLAHDRQEICIAALKHRSLRRMAGRQAAPQQTMAR